LKNKQNIAIFPLSLVVLPGETQMLHIFEQRYISLVNDAFIENKNFVIPYLKINEVKNIGTLVKLKEIQQRYPDGRMDILVEGVKVIKVNEIHTSQNEEICDTANIEYIRSCEAVDLSPLKNIFNKYLEHDDFSEELPDGFVPGLFSIARQIPLTEYEKYQFINQASNIHRTKYLFNKIQMLIIINNRASRLKDKFYLN
jgi:hypothetical protein